MGYEQVIREYIVGKATLIIDNNDPATYQKCKDAAMKVMREEGINTKSEFAMANSGRGDYRRDEIEVEIGSRVSDVIASWVGDIENGTARMLVSDILDLSDRAQWALLGAHYWPDDDEDFDDDPEDVPDDFPVKVLGPDDPATVRATCGECGRSWDDGISTQYTPTPSARCPFELYHFI